jgi:predicted dehydrogenase
MNENGNEGVGFNRRDFLKGGSVATLMTMLGGVEVLGQPTPATSGNGLTGMQKMKVGVIGLGAWGREIINTLVRVTPADFALPAEVAAICDTYEPYRKRMGHVVPGATQTADYKTILADKDIRGVFIATPTYLHKELALAALKAGKHVYCEAPMAGSIEDAREIALAAKAATAMRRQYFQCGLQRRSDPELYFLLPFIRSGALGTTVMARAQWHKKTSWRSASPNPEQEKALNWRLHKATSLGLIGELGSHQVDQTGWFLNGLPTAVTGFGSVMFWKDGRDVPDTIQAVLEFPHGVQMIYDATLADSFDGEYEMLYGSDGALMMRKSRGGESKAWVFKEVDSPLWGWEVYAAKTAFYQDTGIALVAGASKSTGNEQLPTGQQDVPVKTPLWYALNNFLRNGVGLDSAANDYISAYGDDAQGLQEALAKVEIRPGASYLEGFQAVVMAAKANEAILSGQRIEIKPEWYELS